MRLLIFTLFFVILASFAWAEEPQVLLKETFDYPDGPLPEKWWAEGNAASIRNNHLYVDADESGYRRATVWLNRVFQGDIQVEFQVHFIASSDKANNNNFFFLFSNPGEKTLFQTREQRTDGNYPKYHKLSGYIFTHVLNDANKTRFRFRDCPGFHLLKETFAGKSAIGKTYRVKITKRKNRMQYQLDNKTIFEVVDDRQNPTHQKGLLGFRTWHTELWWDDLVVKKITK